MFVKELKEAHPFRGSVEWEEPVCSRMNVWEVERRKAMLKGLLAVCSRHAEFVIVWQRHEAVSNKYLIDLCLLWDSFGYALRFVALEVPRLRNHPKDENSTDDCLSKNDLIERKLVLSWILLFSVAHEPLVEVFGGLSVPRWTAPGVPKAYTFDTGSWMLCHVLPGEASHLRSLN